MSNKPIDIALTDIASDVSAIAPAQPKVVDEVFEVLKLLNEKRLLTDKIKRFLTLSKAATPIVKDATGKALTTHLQEGVFNKKGRERLARLVDDHAQRIKTDMPRESVQFFSVMAIKMIKYVESGSVLSEVFDSLKDPTKH